MSLQMWLTETVTVQTPTMVTDEYNNPTLTYSGGVQVPARLEQTAGTEVTQDRDAQVADWRGFFPPDVELTGNSRVIREDNTKLEVIGPPDRVQDRRGVHHVEARLRAVA